MVIHILFNVFLSIYLQYTCGFIA